MHVNELVVDPSMVLVLLLLLVLGWGEKGAGGYNFRLYLYRLPFGIKKVKRVDLHSKDITQAQQQKHDSPTVIYCRASKGKVYKLH